MKKFTISAIALASWTMASAGYVLIVPISGSPELQITGDLNYGTVMVGESASKELRLRNKGYLKVGVTLTPPAPLTMTDSCSGGIPAGSECTATVTWNPQGRETLSGDLMIQAAGQKPLKRVASGTAILAPKLETVGSIEFGRVQVNTSVTRTLTLKNTGDLPAPVTVAVPAEIVMSGDCTEIPAQGSCNITLTWSPSAVSALANTITVGSNGAQTQISLTGEGYVPLHFTGGSTEDVGSRYTTDGAVARTWTIQNHGTDTANLAYSAMATYMSRSGTCGATLASGATCTVTLTWVPSATTSLDHTVVVSGSNGAQLTQAGLRMTGYATYAFAYNPSIGTTANWDLGNNARAAGWNGWSPLMSTVTVVAGAQVGSYSTGAFAFIIPDGIPAGSKITLINNGQILGQGGAGGAADSGGYPGGPALYVGSAATIYNYGSIAGGGGGGSGSRTQGGTNVAAGGAGGGGGQGYAASAGGAGVSIEGIYPRGGNGGNGGQAGPGGGGAGTASGYYPRQHKSPWYAYSNAGAAGGTWGAAGGNGDVYGGAAGAGVRYGVTPTWGYYGAVYGPVW